MEEAGSLSLPARQQQLWGTDEENDVSVKVFGPAEPSSANCTEKRSVIDPKDCPLGRTETPICQFDLVLCQPMLYQRGIRRAENKRESQENMSLLLTGAFQESNITPSSGRCSQGVLRPFGHTKVCGVLGWQRELANVIARLSLKDHSSGENPDDCKKANISHLPEG